MQRYADWQSLSSYSQGHDPQTHSNHDKHVKAIEKGREYLYKLLFSRGDSRRGGQRTLII
jgi:hypothetical protein